MHGPLVISKRECGWMVGWFFRMHGEYFFHAVAGPWDSEDEAISELARLSSETQEKEP